MGLLATGARAAVLWSEAHTKQRGEVGLCQLEAEVGVLHQALLSTSQSRFPDLLREHLHSPAHSAVPLHRLQSSGNPSEHVVKAQSVLLFLLLILTLDPLTFNFGKDLIVDTFNANTGDDIWSKFNCIPSSGSRTFRG